MEAQITGPNRRLAVVDVTSNQLNMDAINPGLELMKVMDGHPAMNTSFGPCAVPNLMKPPYGSSLFDTSVTSELITGLEGLGRSLTF